MKKPEPVMIAAIATLLAGYAARHGIALPADAIGEVVGAILTLAGMWWARSKVTPVPKPSASQAPPAP